MLLKLSWESNQSICGRANSNSRPNKIVGFFQGTLIIHGTHRIFKFGDKMNRIIDNNTDNQRNPHARRLINFSRQKSPQTKQQYKGNEIGNERKKTPFYGSKTDYHK